MKVFETAFRKASDYRSDVINRRVRPQCDYREMRARFASPLPEEGTSDTAVIEELAELGEAGLMQITHPRFFGWVMGGSSPVSVAADWLASAWGQNAAVHTSSPTAAAIEETVAGWLLDILDLPRESSVGFVTGATLGSFTALAAARNVLLSRVGWDCEADGLFGAPEIDVFVGDDVHTSILSALRYLGFGAKRVVRVDTDDQGRMSCSDLFQKCAARAGPKLIIAQAGQINTGAFDPFEGLSEIARQFGAWLHIDGAFGLWARADPDLRHLTRGIEHADSWVLDGHKWLQVPFDCGYAIVRDGEALQKGMAITASYLPTQTNGDRAPSHLVPELSRRARGLPTWAALKSLGRTGVIEMVRRHCSLARQIAADLATTPGVKVMNNVELNQVILRFGNDGDDPATRKDLAASVIEKLVEEGEVFVGGAQWRGEWVMRLSVISGTATPEDAAIATRAIRRAWDHVSGLKGHRARSIATTGY